MHESWLEKARAAAEQRNSAFKTAQDEAQGAEAKHRLFVIERTRLLYSMLKIEEILEEIKNQVWEGRGKIISEEKTDNTDKPSTSARLEFNYRYPQEQRREPIYQEKFGFHKEPKYEKELMSGYDNVPSSYYNTEVGEKTAFGRYQEKIGERGYYKNEPRVLRGPSITLTGWPKAVIIQVRTTEWAEALRVGVDHERDIYDIDSIKEQLDKVLYEDCNHMTKYGHLPNVLLSEASNEEGKLRSNGFILLT